MRGYVHEDTALGGVSARVGVEIEELPELDTVDGVADIGFALAAWFTRMRSGDNGPT